MSNFYTPVQRGNGKQRDTGSVSPVEPMHKRENAPVQPNEKQKNPNVRKTYSPVDSTHHITIVGLTGDRKKICPCPEMIFPARDLWKSQWLEDQIKSKEAQILGRWRWWLQEHIPKRFQRRSSRIKRNRRKSDQERGFFRTQKLRIERAHES